jgi:hypothetical protein
MPTSPPSRGMTLSGWVTQNGRVGLGHTTLHVVIDISGVADRQSASCRHCRRTTCSVRSCPSSCSVVPSRQPRFWPACRRPLKPVRCGCASPRPSATRFPILSGQALSTSATLTLSSISTPALTETLNLTGATIISVQRTGLTPAEFQGASSTPFNPVLSTIAPAVYGSGNAYFSLVLAGGTDIQLYWFKNDPGTFFQSPTTYPACGKTGVNIVGSNECGQGSNAAIVTFAPVPEPSTYAMLVAGLLTLGFAARRRTRKA